MENKISRLLQQIETAKTEAEINKLCCEIEELNTCKSITLIMQLGLYPTYSKLVSYRRRKLEQLKQAA